jgi:hypothetical protein
VLLPTDLFVKDLVTHLRENGPDKLNVQTGQAFHVMLRDQVLIGVPGVPAGLQRSSRVLPDGDAWKEKERGNMARQREPDNQSNLLAH